MIEANDRLIATTTEQKAQLQRDAMNEIAQANGWKAEADARRRARQA